MRVTLPLPVVGLFVSCLFLCDVLHPLPCQTHETPNVLKFAVFPYTSPRSILEALWPLAARFEAKLGKKVQLVSAPDANAFVTRGMAGEYDLALPSVTAYYRLLPAGYTIIAKGDPPFRGGLIVRQESGINSLEACRGKRIAAIGKHSYAGYMFFMDLLKQRKIAPAKDMHIFLLGKSDSVIYGVSNKRYDAGLIRLDALDRGVFAPIKDRLRVVIQSAEIPQFPFVVKKGMDQLAIAIVREVLIGLSPDKTEDSHILEGLQIKRFVDARKDDYDRFYELIKDSDYIKNH